MGVGEVKRDESALLAAARSGDRAAFGELVRMHQDEVFTLAVRMVGDTHTAADVSQEAFVRAWRALPKFREEARFSTWLHRITVNVAWSTNTMRRRRRAESLDELMVDPPAPGGGPELAGELADLRPRLVAALATLTPRVRAVVVLKDVYGWSHREIGDRLGISVAAAKVRLHRGRKRLRSTLWDEVRDQ